MKEVTLYTDGACSGNPGIGGWGAVLIYKGRQKQLSAAENSTTNNRMELTAIIEGLKALKEPCSVSVYSDSAYAVNAFNNGWITGWAQSGWIKADNKPVLNADLWQKLYELSSTHKLKMIKVKGHADNELNNLCDKLATDAIKNFKSSL